MSYVLAGVTVATAVGGAAYSSSQGKKADKKAGAQLAEDRKAVDAYRKQTAKTNKVEPIVAPQRSAVQEGRDAMQVLQEAYPQLYAAQSQWNPQFAALEARTAGARSAAETDVVRQSGTSIRDAIRGASPEIAASGNALLSQLGNLGPSAIETELNNQALSDLRLGGSLSNEDTRAAIQTARAGSSARGLANGQSGLLAELLNRQSFADARRDQRRGFASAVDAQSQQRTASDRGFILNASQQAMDQYDPYKRIFGAGGSSMTGQVSGMNGFGSYLDAAGNAAGANQSALLAAAGMTEAARRDAQDRQDTLFYTTLNRNDSITNAAAQRAAANNSALLGASMNLAGTALAGYANRTSGTAAPKQTTTPSSSNYI